MTGYIFLCDKDTQYECIERQLFGTKSFDYYEKYFNKIAPGDYLFLYNYNTETLHGVYRALTKCGKNIVSHAWGGRFEYQVKVQHEGAHRSISKREINNIIYIERSPQPLVSEQQLIKLLQLYSNGTIPPAVNSNYWIFKCDKITGGRVFDSNIVGAPTNSFSAYVNKVQPGDTIFVWQIEEKSLYGIWRALDRGAYDPDAFPEVPGKYCAIVRCERNYNLVQGLEEKYLKEIHVQFTRNQMPASNLDHSMGLYLKEKLFEINESVKTDYEPENTIAGKFLTEDGHWVRSQGEALIDNWLYRNNLLHAYEHRIQRTGKFKKTDFYLPKHDLVIEYWGLSGKADYEYSKRDKLEFYRMNGIKLIELFPDDLKMLSEILKNKLSKYQVTVL